MLTSPEMYEANLFHGHKHCKAYRPILIGYLQWLRKDMAVIGSGGAQ
jgi:hypothetical protein